MAAMKPPCKNPKECYKLCKHGAFACDDPNARIYTPKPGKCPAASGNHSLVREAALKGLTGIRILKYPNKALHLGYEVTEASNRINKISI
jgi:hypothetical protein